MLMLGTVPLAGHLKTKLFTTSGSFVVPADVSVIWIDGSGGGGGGGGGDPTPGGGGGGGGPAMGTQGFQLPVSPADTLTITIGAGGAGGAAGANGGDGGESTIAISGVTVLYLSFSGGGSKGTPSAGGNGSAVAYGSPGSNYGLPYTAPLYMPAHFALAQAGFYFSGTNGGALSNSGGGRNSASRVGGVYNSGAAGNASGGGGGHGGITPWGRNTDGVGGANGAPGGAATGYGCGGGGGSGDAAGGDGGPGFIRLYMITGYTI